MHITFPTARPPTTERMTPQTLITRVCKTETTGTAHHMGGTRNTTAAATGDTDPAGASDPGELVILSPPLWQWGWPTFFLARAKNYPKLLFPAPAADPRAGGLTTRHQGGTATEPGSTAGQPGAHASSSSAAAQAGTTPWTKHAWASLAEGPHRGQKAHIPPPPASYLEADNVRDLHAVEIAFDLGNATASCDRLRGAGTA